MPQRSVRYVGRDDALKRLGSALAQAAAGAGSVVLVHGEAGIGKTRLCDEAARAHRDRGGAVLVGRAAPEETAIAFGPIADALRAARRAEPALWEAATAHAGVLSAVVPELTGRAAGGERRYADRPVLFEALLDAVEESARADQAVLWVLDDVHWADDPSWHFIAYAARRVAAMSLVLAVSYREEEIGPGQPAMAEPGAAETGPARDQHAAGPAERRRWLPGGQGARFYAASHAAAGFRLAPGISRAAEARSAASAAPWPWLSALIMLWEGEFPGDAEAAAGSAVLFEHIGAPLGIRRAERMLSRMGLRPSAQHKKGPLSDREMEVAQLVAEGLSNPAIAGRLYLSRPTVASHVTHILTKLGFSSRAQIAVWVAAQPGQGLA